MLKRILSILNFLWMSAALQAQAPNLIPFQGIARSASGNIISSQPISLRISLHDVSAAGTIVYQETHSASTNSLGLFNINIGQGTPITGTFATINWGSTSKFIEVELDITGGNSYTNMGTTQLMSVPYALFANRSNDLPQGSGNGNTMHWGGTAWIADNNIHNNGANVGVGTAVPVSSAKLEVNSNSKGFLPPRMTQAERNSIAGPVPGLMLWCSDCGLYGELQVYNGFGWTNSVGEPTSPPETVFLCGQYWTVKNLDVSTYRNGDPIPKVTDPLVWDNLTTGAYCYYNNDSVTYAATYGKLYNWFAVNDARGLAPVGWHIPSDPEWITLGACLGGDNVAGGAMKEAGTQHWINPNVSATNSSGFTGLPAGYRSGGISREIGGAAIWWSTTQAGGGQVWYRSLSNTWGVLNTASDMKTSGLSVRCVKD